MVLACMSSLRWCTYQSTHQVHKDIRCTPVQGTLAAGLNPPAVLTSDKPLLHPSVAKLESQFRGAAPVMPPPPQVPEPEMPQEPEILRR